VHNKDRFRKLKQTIKMITPKKVRVSGNFCKYGRVYSNLGNSTQSGYAMIIPVNGNQNNNWKI